MGRFVAEVLGFPYLAGTFPMHSNLTGDALFAVWPAYLSGCFFKGKVLFPCILISQVPFNYLQINRHAITMCDSVRALGVERVDDGVVQVLLMTCSSLVPG